MEIQLKQGVNIENPRHYSALAIEQLRQLLVAGELLQPDPKRQNFYEVAGGDETYYIHVSPISGNVVLLARWIRHADECCQATGHFAA